MENPCPYYPSMDPKTNSKDSGKHSQNNPGPRTEPENSTPMNLAVKIKEEPPDWSVSTPSQNQNCGGGMPIHTSPQAVCPPPMGPIPSYPAHMNGMAHLPPHMTQMPPFPMMNYPMMMPHIKAEPCDQGYIKNFPQGPGNLPNPMPCDVQIKQEPLSTSYQNNPIAPQPIYSNGTMAPVSTAAGPVSMVTTNNTQTTSTTTAAKPAPKRKSRSKKAQSVEVKKEIKQETITDSIPVVKKKRDRFNGMSEEEVLKRTLPDHLRENLDIAIIGINPGLCAAYVGHHYAGPGNHFWKCLYLSGLIPEPMNAYDDTKLQDYGIGFTNIVERTSRGSADLSKKEIKEGSEILTTKIQKYKPKIAVFNGKGIYEVFHGNKNFYIGKQPEPFPGCPDTLVFVMPSSSARCSQLPRAVDKVPFYLALKRLRDYCVGTLKEVDDKEVTFPDLELKVEPRKDKSPKVKEEGGGSGKKNKRKAENDVLDNMAMNAMNNTSGMPPPPPTSMGYPPIPFPPWGPHPGLPMTGPQVPGLPGPPSMDNIFGGHPPVLVKQEDMTELAHYGITSNTFQGQSYLSGCPAPQLPKVSLPGPWHNQNTNAPTSTSSFPTYNSSMTPVSNNPSMMPNPRTPPTLSHSPAFNGSASVSSHSPNQSSNSRDHSPFNPSYQSNSQYSSPNYIQQQSSPNLNGPQTPGPMSPSFPQPPQSSPVFANGQYPFNGSNVPNMGFG